MVIRSSTFLGKKFSSQAFVKIDVWHFVPMSGHHRLSEIRLQLWKGNWAGRKRERHLATMLVRGQEQPALDLNTWTSLLLDQTLGVHQHWYFLLYQQFSRVSSRGLLHYPTQHLVNWKWWELNLGPSSNKANALPLCYGLALGYLCVNV